MVAAWLSEIEYTWSKVVVGSSYNTSGLVAWYRRDRHGDVRRTGGWRRVVGELKGDKLLVERSYLLRLVEYKAIEFLQIIKCLVRNSVSNCW